MLATSLSVKPHPYCNVQQRRLRRCEGTCGSNNSIRTRHARVKACNAEQSRDLGMQGFCRPNLLLCCAAEDVAEDVKGPVVLATASGRGPTGVRAFNTEQSRVLEGVSADSYFVEPSLVADDLPEQLAVPVHAMAPLSANTHNNAAAAPVLAPEPVLASASGLVDHGAAAFVPATGPSSSKGNANAHNNAV